MLENLGVEQYGVDNFQYHQGMLVHATQVACSIQGVKQIYENANFMRIASLVTMSQAHLRRQNMT